MGARGLFVAFVILLLAAAVACGQTQTPAADAVRVADGAQDTAPAPTVRETGPSDSAEQSATRPGPALDPHALPQEADPANQESGPQVPTGLIVNLIAYTRGDLPSVIDHGEPVNVASVRGYLRSGGWIRKLPSPGDNYTTRTWEDEALTVTFEGDRGWMRLTAKSEDGPVDEALVLRMAEDFVRLGWSGWYERYRGVEGLEFHRRFGRAADDGNG